jgi:hypothetical protein
MKKYNSDTCCICNEKLSERAHSPLWLLGNNPWPVIYDPTDIARACDVCNALEVTPARLKSYFSSRDHLSGRSK